MLALWETKFSTPSPAKGPAPSLRPAVRAEGASWGSPTARARFQTGAARAKYTAQRRGPDGRVVEQEMRSTPEGVAWFFAGL